MAVLFSYKTYAKQLHRSQEIIIMDYSADTEDDTISTYLYDLYNRQPTTEHILEQLKESHFFKAFKISSSSKRGLKCRWLTEVDVDSELDPDVVDWYDFQSGYIQSLYDCRGTNKKNSIERSHDQIDILINKLCKELQNEYPPHIKDSPQQKLRDQWSSDIAVLAMEYVRIFNCSILRGVPDLPTRVRGILERSWQPSDKTHEETMYYVAGAVLKMISGLGERAKDKYINALLDIESNATTSKEGAQSASLPSGKVERNEVHNLTYVNRLFYDFVNRIESVFETLLCEKEMALYGHCIVKDITRVLCKEELGFNALLSNTHDEDVIAEVLRRIIWSYGRLRGKDFVRKCNAKMGTKHHETTRSTLGTTAAIAAKNAKDGKDGSESVEETNPRWKYLMKQKKADLVTMCKGRNIHYSGTKKILTRRIIEYDEKQQLQSQQQQQHNNSSDSTTLNTTTTIIDDEESEYLQGIIDSMEEEQNELVNEFDAHDDHSN